MSEARHGRFNPHARGSGRHPGRRSAFFAGHGAVSTVAGLLALCWWSALAPGAAGAEKPPSLGQGSDLEVGGPGDGHGTFRVLRGIAFDRHNSLYVLDGAL